MNKSPDFVADGDMERGFMGVPYGIVETDKPRLSRVESWVFDLDAAEFEGLRHLPPDDIARAHIPGGWVLADYVISIYYDIIARERLAPKGDLLLAADGINRSPLARDRRTIAVAVAPLDDIAMDAVGFACDLGITDVRHICEIAEDAMRMAAGARR